MTHDEEMRLLEAGLLHAWAFERLAGFIGVSEARVVLDRAYEVAGLREVSEGEARWVLEDARAWTHFYVLRYASGGAPGLLDNYERWLSTETFAFSLDDMERAYRRIKYGACPFVDIDDLDVRYQCPVPVSTERPPPSSVMQESMWFVDWGVREPRYVVRIDNIDTSSIYGIAPKPKDELADCPLSPRAIDQTIADYAEALGVSHLLRSDNEVAAYRDRKRRLDGRVKR